MSTTTQNVAPGSNAIADSLRETRLAAGLTLRALAVRAGTSHATISAYEGGRKVPSAETWLRLLDACGFGVDLTLRPRIRESNGVPRGEELLAVLELAEQFPARPDKTLRFPPLKHISAAE
ncbi:MAG: helix-turn-helix domain-containing protein [Pseudomonadaceae bacterium]|nr:helix-turn-helix domain-containing protein [Pseudomonadaceae bacterium]